MIGVFKIFLLASYFAKGSGFSIDAYVVHEFLDYEVMCPNSGPGYDGPSFNITRSQDYQDFTVCWRFMLTAYCKVNQMRVLEGPCCVDDILRYQLFAPRGGQQVVSPGIAYYTTDKDKGPEKQVPWHNIYYKKPIKIFDWQNVCLSYNKHTHSIYHVHNGRIVYQAKVRDENIRIRKDFLSYTTIFSNSRGAFTDLQVYSKPMSTEDLIRWTSCQYEDQGDVFQWNISQLNMMIGYSHVKDINDYCVNSFEKVDTESFCKSVATVEMFGDDGGRTGKKNSYYEYSHLCKQYNGKAHLIPKDEVGLRIFFINYHIKLYV